MQHETMTRRALLVGAAGAGASVALAGSLDASPMRQPNVLWIVADDHAPYVTGTYGNRVVRTPRLDRLASEGIRFDNAYCCSPVCTAARQAFLTGRYPRSIGVTQLASVLPDSQRTLAHELADTGYETAAFGKMHFNSPLKHGFERRLDIEEFNAMRKQAGRKPLPADVKVQPPWRPFKDPAPVWLNSACLPFDYNEDDTSAVWFAGQAERFMREPLEKPFFLVASFYEPHSPYNFPVEYRGRHAPGDFSAPRVSQDDAGQVPLVFKDMTDAQKCGSIAAYYTSAEFLDRSVGRVLDALEKSGQADNTLVVYLADHGYLLGQHGRFEKHSGFDPAIRVPLIMRLPGTIRPGSHSTAMVQSNDLAPTILELCGLKAPGRMQGNSFRKVLGDPATEHRDHVVIEYSENAEAYIRTDRWKFIYCAGNRARKDGYVTSDPTPGRTVRLYDLHADPDEMTNLAGKPEHADRIAAFTEQLTEHLRVTARVGSNGSLDQLLQPADVPRA
jgi:choline-sulfatase